MNKFKDLKIVSMSFTIKFVNVVVKRERNPWFLVIFYSESYLHGLFKLRNVKIMVVFNMNSVRIGGSNMNI